MKHVMFVCKKNSARSQMAEGFAKTLGQDLIEVTSSGLEASQVNPGAIALFLRKYSYLLPTTMVLV